MMGSLFGLNQHQPKEKHIMSTSLLYHTQAIRGFQFQRFDCFGGQIASRGTLPESGNCKIRYLWRLLSHL